MLDLRFQNRYKAFDLYDLEVSITQDMPGELRTNRLESSRHESHKPPSQEPLKETPLSLFDLKTLSQRMRFAIGMSLFAIFVAGCYSWISESKPSDQEQSTNLSLESCSLPVEELSCQKNK